MEPLKLSEQAIAWAESIGISRKRAEWLASCPKFTPVSRLPPAHKRPKSDLCHLIKLASGIWVYRRRIRTLEVQLHISTEESVARYHRDRINRWLEPMLKMPINDLAALLTKAHNDNPDAFPRLSKPRAFSSRRPNP